MSKQKQSGVRLEELYAKPGHLIRRCHQIAVALFLEELQDLNLTPIQFAILAGVDNHPDIDQISLAGLVACDRTTIGNVVERLEGRGLLTRTVDDTDRRVRLLRLTDDGRAVLADARPCTETIQQKLLAPLTEAERQQFVSLLTRIADAHNETSRAPLVTARRRVG